MLSPEILTERKKGIGASEANRIVSGDWHMLWLEKTGRMEPKPILGDWDMAVRHTMEPLILDWYQRKFDVVLIHRGVHRIWKDYPVIMCTLDGYNPQALRPVDAKCLNIFTPDPLKWCVDHYAAQMQHQMIVTDSHAGELYVTLGMKEPEKIEFEKNEFWCLDYIERCREFWGYVASDTPPPGAPMMAAAPLPVEVMREVDMSSSNEWGEHATKWLETRKAAGSFEKAAKALKGLVGVDVKRAFGKGIEIKRSKAGSLSIKEE